MRRTVIKAIGLMTGALVIGMLLLGARRGATCSSNPRRLVGDYGQVVHHGPGQGSSATRRSRAMEFEQHNSTTHFLGDNLVFEPGRFDSPFGYAEWYGDDHSRLVLFESVSRDPNDLAFASEGHWIELTYNSSSTDGFQEIHLERDYGFRAAAVRSVDIGGCSIFQPWTITDNELGNTLQFPAPRGCGIMDQVMEGMRATPPVREVRDILSTQFQITFALFGHIFGNGGAETFLDGEPRWRTQYRETMQDAPNSVVGEVCVELPLRVDTFANVISVFNSTCFAHNAFWPAGLAACIAEPWCRVVDAHCEPRGLGCRYHARIEACFGIGTTVIGGQREPVVLQRSTRSTFGPGTSYDERLCEGPVEIMDGSSMTREAELRFAQEFAANATAQFRANMFTRETPEYRVGRVEYDPLTCEVSHRQLEGFPLSDCHSGATQGERDQRCADAVILADGVSPSRIRATCEQRFRGPCTTDADCHPRVFESAPCGGDVCGGVEVSPDELTLRDHWGCTTDEAGARVCGDTRPMCYWNIGPNRFEISPMGLEFVLAENRTGDDSALPLAQSNFCVRPVPVERRWPGSTTKAFGTLGWQTGARRSDGSVGTLLAEDEGDEVIWVDPEITSTPAQEEQDHDDLDCSTDADRDCSAEERADDHADDDRDRSSEDDRDDASDADGDGRCDEDRDDASDEDRDRQHDEDRDRYSDDDRDHRADED